MFSVLCKGICCVLKTKCLRWLHYATKGKDDDQTIISKCDEESRDLYATS